MKTYFANRTRNGCYVLVNREPLPLRLDLRNHSPDGFNWGYQGSGPAQLALALLADALEDDDAAHAVYQEFKRRVVSAEQREQWTLTDDWIRGWVACYNTLRPVLPDSGS